MNEHLKNAMIAAHVDIDSITRATDVDPKTVQRWLKGRVPHARHRWKIADLLQVPEQEIWSGKNNGTMANTPEVVATYGRRSDTPASAWWQLFIQANKQIDMLANAMLFIPEQNSRLVDLLKEKADNGCHIRIALADPNCEAVHLRDGEEGLNGTLPGRIRTTLYHFRSIRDSANIEIKYHSTTLYSSVFRGDDELFVTPHLYALHGSKAPLLHLRYVQEEGVFATFARYFDDVWATTFPIE
jgi:phosphatidylserine/phosphatidylglycerophosphate/cardiolipin synthase-like enzyme